MGAPAVEQEVKTFVYQRGNAEVTITVKADDQLKIDEIIGDIVDDTFIPVEPKEVANG